MKKLIKLFLTVALILIPGFALAAEDGEMAIYPNEWDGQNDLTKYWFIYNLDKGEGKDDKVVVENLGDSPLEIKIYPVDATTTSDGAFALRNEDEPKEDIGGWVKLSASELSLNPKEKKVVDFRIDIPKDVVVGEHIGGIVVENKAIKMGKQLNLKTRVGVRIYETVPGVTQKKVNLTDINAKGFYNSIASVFYNWSLQYKISNEGNVQISPETQVSVDSPWFGQVFTKKQKVNGTIFPKKDITEKIELSDKLWFGPYNIAITAQEEGLSPVQKTITLWVLPWKLTVILVALFLLLISWLYLSKNEKKEENNFFAADVSEEIKPKKKIKKAVKKKVAKKTKPKKKK